MRDESRSLGIGDDERGGSGEGNGKREAESILFIYLWGPAVAVADALGEEGRRTSLSAADVRSAMPRRRYAMRRKARPSKRRAGKHWRYGAESGRL